MHIQNSRDINGVEYRGSIHKTAKKCKVDVGCWGKERTSKDIKDATSRKIKIRVCKDTITTTQMMILTTMMMTMTTSFPAPRIGTWSGFTHAILGWRFCVHANVLQKKHLGSYGSKPIKLAKLPSFIKLNWDHFPFFWREDEWNIHPNQHVQWDFRS